MNSISEIQIKLTASNWNYSGNQLQFKPLFHSVEFALMMRQMKLKWNAGLICYVWISGINCWFDFWQDWFGKFTAPKHSLPQSIRNQTAMAANQTKFPSGLKFIKPVHHFIIIEVLSLFDSFNYCYNNFWSWLFELLHSLIQSNFINQTECLQFVEFSLLN